MISYEIAQQQPNFEQKDSHINSSRVRVLGVIEDKRCVLYSIATSKATEIQLYNQNGISTTVIAFNKYMDIVAADISFDMEMILYTERIILTNTNCKKRAQCDQLFKYESVLCNINSFSKLQVFDDFNPISSYFIPYVEDNKFTSNFDFYKTNSHSSNDYNEQEFKKSEYISMLQSKKEESSKSYQFIHIIGDKVSHFRAAFKKQKIYVRMIHNGINLSKCQKWFFSKQDLVFYSFNDGKFSAYNILNDKQKGASIAVETQSYKNDPSSILPQELALNSSTLTNLPYFRFSSGISYVVKININGKVDYGIIEQLYKGEDSFLSFNVATIYGKFKNTVTVRGIQPDLPISFLSSSSNRNAVFVFVPNCFIAFVDFTFQNPHISMMPHVFSETSVTSQITSTIDFETNFVIDLKTGKLYETFLKIKSFPKSLHYADRMILSIIAHLVATFPDQVSISSAIENIPSDISYIQLFFKSVFSVTNQLMPTKNLQLFDNKSSTTVMRTRSDTTHDVYDNKLIKEQLPHCKSSFNLHINNIQSQKFNLMVPDDLSNTLSSSSSTSSISDKFLSESNKSLSLNHAKSFSEITKMVMKKADFVRLIRDNIELLFSLGSLSEKRIFLIELIASYEVISAKMPESSAFISNCSERALQYCPFTIRQLLCLNNLIYYPHKITNQKNNGRHIKKLNSENNQISENNNIPIDRIIESNAKERNQILYWKKKLSFLKKDENFFQSKKSSSSLRKRTKSNIYISSSQLNQNVKNVKMLNSKEYLFEQILEKENNKDESLKLKIVPYISKRRSSFNTYRTCSVKSTHI